MNQLPPPDHNARNSYRFLLLKNICEGNINVLMFNARGLKSKLINLDNELALLDKLPHKIMVTEAWFDISVVLLYGVILQNYDVFRNDRNRHDVMILCDKVLNAQPVDNSIYSEFPGNCM